MTKIDVKRKHDGSISLLLVEENNDLYIINMDKVHTIDFVHSKEDKTYTLEVEFNYNHKVKYALTKGGYEAIKSEMKRAILGINL